VTKRINKGEIIDTIAGALALPKAATEAVINNFLMAVQASVMNGNEVSLMGFGSFSRRDRPERQGRNPATGETLLLAPSSTLAFRPSKTAQGGADAAK
jgi:DNA-binding protein HU-beta